jgi:hypothetical protein
MEIKTSDKKERIAVSIDDYEDDRGPLVVMLYVPHLDYPEHEHIEFDKEAATQLRDFLNKFLEQ